MEKQNGRRMMVKDDDLYPVPSPVSPQGASSSQAHDLGGLISKVHPAPENQRFDSAKSRWNPMVLGVCLPCGRIRK